MTDKEIGRAFRAVRVKKGLRQTDVARLAGVSQQTVSRVERGLAGEASLDRLRRIADAIDARVVVEFRWEGAGLDRLLGARHSAMHNAMAAFFSGLPDWVSSPEVSFAVFGERGVIDILVWHQPTRSLLVVELKTELADMQETFGTLDRKVRLAPRIAKERGWDAKTVSAWLVIAESTGNRDRVQAHAQMLRSALPADGPRVRAWLRRPIGQMRALSFLAAPGEARSFSQPRRVHVQRPAPASAD